MDELVATRGEKSLEGIVLTLDRGYATQDSVIRLLEKGTVCVSILNTRSNQRHPFVGKYYLTPGRDDDSDEEFSVDSEAVTIASSRVPVRLDRPANFVVDDSPNVWLRCFRAVKSYGRGQTAQKVVALAVLNHGKATQTKVVRFLHAIPTPMDESFTHWVTTHHTWDLKEYLYNYKNPNGRIAIPTSDEGKSSTKQAVELHMTESSRVLTVAQRCSDWFTMREFRLTSTSAVNLLLKSEIYRAKRGLPPLETTVASSLDLLETLSRGWFSTVRSRDAMLRGTVNEDAVLNCFAQRKYIEAVYKVGMLCDKKRPWIATSLDAIAVFDLRVCRRTEAPDGDANDDEEDPHVAPVEIKTAVSRGSVARGTSHATHELITCEMYSDLFMKYVPKGHAAQLVLHCVATDMRWIFYVCTSASQILYTVLSICKNETINAVSQFYDANVTPSLRWAHEKELGVQPLTGNGEVDSLVAGRLSF